MIVDAHIHLFPEDAKTATASWATARDEPAWLACVKPASGPQLQGWSSVRQLLLDMDAAGVDKAVIQGWYWENADTCIEQNAWIAQAISSHRDRLFQMASFNAIGQQASLDDLAKTFDHGAIGIGELNPPAQGYTYRDETLADALDLAGAAGRCVNLHVTEPAGHDYPGKVETPLSELQALARRHPETRFIFAHLGGLLPFYEYNPTARKDLANVVYDTAAVPLLYSKEIYRALIDKVGRHRILFGTDYPLRTFPKTQTKPGFAEHLAQLRSCALSEEELRSVLGENAARVLKF